MPVVDRNAQSIDLSNQGEALDATVLDKIRGVLQSTDFFLHLSLSYNNLSDECVAILCSILKGKTCLETLEVQQCGFSDKDFSLYLMPAILTRNKLKALDLSKNERLTDRSVDALCRLITEGDLVRLRLVGTKLTGVSGHKIAQALEGNTTMEVCELPFTVGFDVLRRVALLVERNIQHKNSIEEAKNARKEMKDMLVVVDEMTRALGSKRAQQGQPSSALTTYDTHLSATSSKAADAQAAASCIGVTRSQLEQIALARYYTSKERKNAIVIHNTGGDSGASGGDANPRCTRGGGHPQGMTTRSAESTGRTAGPSTQRSPSRQTQPKAGAGPPLLPLTLAGGADGGAPFEEASGKSVYGELNDFGTLHVATFRCVTDPAVNRSLHHLRVLDNRCRVVEQYRRALQEECRHRRGLDTTLQKPGGKRPQA